MNARDNTVAAPHPVGPSLAASRELIELLLLNAGLEAASVRDPAALEKVRQVLSSLGDALGSTTPPS